MSVYVGCIREKLKEWKNRVHEGGSYRILQRGARLIQDCPGELSECMRENVVI